MRTHRVVACLILFVCSVALARDDAPPFPGDDKTDGLAWDKDNPKAVVVGVAGQIQMNGGVDTTKYKDGLILDKDEQINVYVYHYYVTAITRVNELYSKTVNLNDGLKTWTWTTDKNGGFPPGNYAVEVKVEKFRPDVNTDPRPATLTKEPFQIK